MTGFGAVPEELQAASRKIGDAVGQATDCGWGGPSGDYGHPGVMSSWDQFIKDLEKHVWTLKDDAEWFGAGLVDAARTYLETDVANQADFGKAGEGLGIGAAPAGVMNPEVARRLNPNWTPPPGGYPEGIEF
jgi:hypothetical protein